MSIKSYKLAAGACLVLAIAAIALALLASQQRVKIQGPSALAVAPDGSVWLGVDDALWRFGADGRRLAAVPAAALGLPGAPSNLVPHPDGRLVVSVRNDPALYLLDPQAGRVTARIVPRWPAELGRHAARAIHFAVHPDGRIAIATGGGHAVALFDAQGQFLGRTKPGLYEFTNGLWWSGDRLWTTDTNRFALVALDGRSLQEQERVALAGPLARCRFPGMVAPGGEGMGALTTLVRFDNNMVEGEVVDVLPTGEQRLYPSARRLEPRDIKRLGADLLVVDGASYAVKRYSAARNELQDFGDAASREALSAAGRLRADLQRRYVGGLVAGIALFALGLGLALRAQHLEKGAQLQALGADLSQLGTLRLADADRRRILLRMLWPLLVGAALVALYVFPLKAGWWGAPRLGPSLAVLGVSLLLTLAGLVTAVLEMRRARRDPLADAFVNQAAVAVLQNKDTFWKQRLPGELPRETLMLFDGWRGRQWLVLTNQRLLLFTSNLTDHVLREQHARRDIAGAERVPPSGRSFIQKVQALGGAEVIRLRFRDGSVLEGVTWAALTAQRLLQLLSAGAMAGSAAGAPAEAAGPTAFSGVPRAAAGRAPGEVADESRAWRETLASLLVPGLGQRMQGRSGTSLVMFAAWAVLLVMVALPVFWTWWAPRAAVSPRLLALVATAYVLTCATAAFDAWRMRER